MERFIYHHPNLYRQILTVTLACFLLAGVASLVVPAGAPKSIAMIGPGMAPPSQAAALRAEGRTQGADFLPKGFEKATRLPGRDGSADPALALKPQPAAPLAPTAATRTAIPLGNGDVMSLGRALNAVEFGDKYWPALQALWTRESNWNPNARNPTSGACGIPQALPCSKIPDMSPQGQIEWGLKYIRQRYGNPQNAWQFWLAHRWY